MNHVPLSIEPVHNRMKRRCRLRQHFNVAASVRAVRLYLKVVSRRAQHQFITISRISEYPEKVGASSSEGRFGTNDEIRQRPVAQMYFRCRKPRGGKSLLRDVLIFEDIMDQFVLF